MKLVAPSPPLIDTPTVRGRCTTRSDATDLVVKAPPLGSVDVKSPTNNP
jgi:hypothetical protein